MPVACRPGSRPPMTQYLVTVHSSKFGTTNRIPQLYELILSPGSQAIPFRTPGQGTPRAPANATLMGLERMDLRRLLQPLDHANRPVLRPGGQAGTVQAPRQRPDRPTVGGQGINSRPLAASQTLAVPSKLPDARCAPSGLHASDRISPNCCEFGLYRVPGWPEPLARGRVPDPDLAVVAARASRLPFGLQATDVARTRDPATRSTPDRGSSSRSSRCRHRPPRPGGCPAPCE